MKIPLKKEIPSLLLFDSGEDIEILNSEDSVSNSSDEAAPEKRTEKFTAGR